MSAILAFPTPAGTTPDAFTALLNQFLTEAAKRAMAQHEYNQRVNIPGGIVSAADAPLNAVVHGIVSAWNAIHHWSCEPAALLAHDVLEDVNMHSEAAPLWDTASAAYQG